MQFFGKNKYYRILLKIIYSYLPLVLFIAYPILIGYVYFYENQEIFKIILIPLFTYLSVTLFRKLINAPRPYEKYGIPSVFKKTTKGHSMPSRHTASAFIIAIAILYIDFDLGISAVCIAALIALSRILAGVHFVRDVLVGAGISILLGFIFFIPV